MPRRRNLETSTGVDHDQVIAWYREQLAAPAVFPWAKLPWHPACIGPTWQTTSDGHWLLPELTLGWDVLGWCGTTYKNQRNEDWRFTLEQARFLLWWYALDDRGQFLSRDGVLQRLKGWGKDPIGACISGAELVGPCRFAYFDNDGQPVPTDQPDAWVQTAAVSLEQTKNTMRLFPGLFKADARRYYRIQPGKEIVHAYNGERIIQAVTSSPATLEGARATFVLPNETQHWLSSNEGHEMAAVIERNATKSPGGSARTLRITNAYEPGLDSVAERDRDAYEAMESGESLSSGLLYDSLEAPPEAPLTVNAAPEVVSSVRGDSDWLNVERILQSILDPRNPPSRSRRFWYNQITAVEDAWLTPQLVDATAVPQRRVLYNAQLTDRFDDDEITLFFDGSKSDDATGLVACRLADGHEFTAGVWQKPQGEAGKGWLAPRSDVDARVDEVFRRYKVVAFYADPSHVKDDEGERYWDGLIDDWHRRYAHRIHKKLWAVQTGDNRSAFMWDMTSSERQRLFTSSAERYVEDVESGSVTHDGHPLLVQHLKNARRRPNAFGVSLGKEHRESARKVDLAVCAVGARMLYRIVLNLRAEKRQRTGKAVFV